MQHHIAAVFVKTPGLSPLKTRLAKGTDEHFALDFYKRSCKAIETTLQQWRHNNKDHQNRQGYWAIAESEGLTKPFWQGLPRVLQSGNGLGAKLANVFTQLKAPATTLTFLGGDAPQITAQNLEQACTLGQETDCVIGPASDGGFYLFHTRHIIPESIWRGVRYSQASTCEELCHKLEAYGFEIGFLPQATDVDSRADIPALISALGQEHTHLDHQKLSHWLTAQQHIWQ